MQLAMTCLFLFESPKKYIQGQEFNQKRRLCEPPIKWIEVTSLMLITITINDLPVNNLAPLFCPHLRLG